MHRVERDALRHPRSSSPLRIDILVYLVLRCRCLVFNGMEVSYRPYQFPALPVLTSSPLSALLVLSFYHFKFWRLCALVGFAVFPPVAIFGPACFNVFTIFATLHVYCITILPI